jgi:hypothetical protein
MYDPLIQVARTQLDKELARLGAGVTMTPQIAAALARLEAATAELIAWAQTSLDRVPGDSLETPIGPWVRSICALRTAIDPEDPDEENEIEFFAPELPPDTPLAEWIAGVEALLAELDEGKS